VPLPAAEIMAERPDEQNALAADTRGVSNHRIAHCLIDSLVEPDEL
jgi:hypothetical protein